MWFGFVGLIMRLFSLFINKPPAIVPVAEGLGEQTQKTADTQAALKTETAVANAEANAPSTVAGVETRLNQGTF